MKLFTGRKIYFHYFLIYLCAMVMAFLTETRITRQPTKSVSKRLTIAVRIRPLQEEETGRSIHSISDKIVVLEENEADKNDILRQNRGGERQYVFDAVFAEDVSQEMIFERTTKVLVKDVLEGYNATVFAYGASGSGKTHTMLGNTSQPGIMIRALNEIFTVIEDHPLREQFSVTMSYLEIYNENIRDLLNPNSGFLELREDQKEKTVHVVKLSEVSTNSTEEDHFGKNQTKENLHLQPLHQQQFAEEENYKFTDEVEYNYRPFAYSVSRIFRSAYETRHFNNPHLSLILFDVQRANLWNVTTKGFLRHEGGNPNSAASLQKTKALPMMRLLQKGNKARTMEPTALNKTSSRSHALLSITVRQSIPLQSDDKINVRVKQGRLFMIDLAGSERASQTKNQGKRLVEGAHINRSLLALGNCINALSGGARYVNYRDSKLTRLLKDALSGNSQTCMIAHVSPAALHREESKNTLIYAERAKNISNKVEKNVLDISHQVSQYRTIISELRNEIARLKSKIPEDKKNPQQNRPKIRETVKEVGKNEGTRQSPSKESHLNALKNEIISTFREQMKLRKRLLNIESYMLELDLEADRQNSVIHGHEGKSNRVYRSELHSGKMPEQPDLGSLDLDYQEVDKDPRKSLERALIELALIEKEQEKYSDLRNLTETELEKCKEKAALLERELPYEINTEDEKELLSLLIRVYELEIEKIVFQSERLTREYTLRQRDMTIERYNRQKQICEEIILRQREVMEEGNLTLPSDLLRLYQVYQQEIQQSSYVDQNSNEFTSSHGFGKLPPIVHRRMDYSHRTHSSDNGLDDSDNSTRTPSSSAGSDWLSSPLPPITGRRFSSFSTNNNLPPAAVLFPPISKSHQELR